MDKLVFNGLSAKYPERAKKIGSQTIASVLIALVGPRQWGQVAANMDNHDGEHGDRAKQIPINKAFLCGLIDR